MPNIRRHHILSIVGLAYLLVSWFFRASSITSTTDIPTTRRAADRGDPVAQYYLALRYATGNGLSRNDLLAFHWYEQAAKQGLAAAQNNVGAAYMKGKGVERNPSEGIEWYRR